MPLSTMPETAPKPARTYWSLGLVPAQSWIAEARRSRDLLAGSRLLAWSMGRLLASLGTEGVVIRLPDLQAVDREQLSATFEAALHAGSSGVPNHASGWIEGPLEAAERRFAHLEKALGDSWRELHTDVADATRRSARDLWNEVGSAIGQPVCPLQLVWALKETAAAESEGLAEVDALFSAVKRSRPVPVHQGGPVRKCGQCGKRESLGGPDPKSWRTLQATLARLPEVQQGLRFDAAEHLCPVCALRRLAGYLREDPFASTSAIAASEWLWRIHSVEDLRAALRALEAAAQRVPGYEKDWADRAPLYYERSLKRELRRVETETGADRKPALTEVQAAQHRLAAAIRKHNKEHPEAGVPEAPPEYLAVVMFDGDDMGTQLRKDLAALPGKVVEFQRQLASRLDRRGPEEPPRGEPFYLGGDEGLVLAPIDSVLELAQEIKRIWESTAGSTAGQASLSMGIALFDRERPLGAAIETARRSLERAKQVPKKNALSVSVQTASGSEWTAVARWGTSWERASTAVELIRSDSLAAGWPHDVERFLRTLAAEAFRGDDLARDAIREEVKRITRRRSDQKVPAWEQLQGENWWQEQPSEEELATQADHLHLIAFLAQQAGRAPGRAQEA